MMEAPERAAHVAIEAERLAWVSLYRAECHVTAARFYSNLNTFAGMIGAGAGATAGGTAFAGATIAAGIAGIVAALAAGFITIHKPDERTQSHWSAARSYGRLADEIRMFFRFGWTRGGNLTDKNRPSEEGRPERQAADAAAPLPALERLAEFRARSADLEDATFPVPRRLCVKTERFMATHDEWYPPDGVDFEEWQRRRLTWKKLRWRPWGSSPAPPDEAAVTPSPSGAPADTARRPAQRGKLGQDS
jgi:hypothetical protein